MSLAKTPGPHFVIPARAGMTKYSGETDVKRGLSLFSA